MSADKSAGAGVGVVLAACCGLHAVLLLFGGIMLAGLSLGTWALTFGGLVVLVVAVVRFRRHRCPVPVRPATERRATAMPSAVGRAELQRLLGAGAQLVEVLPKEEYDQEHLPAAVNLPLKQLDAQSAAETSTPPGRWSSTAGTGSEI